LESVDGLPINPVGFGICMDINPEDFKVWERFLSAIFLEKKTHDCVFAIEVSDFLNVYMDVSKK